MTENKFPAVTLKGRPLLVLGVILLIMANYALFAPEIGSAFWHLFHGSHVEMQGIRFKVPRLYYVDSGFQRNAFGMESFQGIVRQHFVPAPLFSTSIDVETRPAMISHVQLDPQREAFLLQKMGRKPVSEFAAAIAGRQGLCKKTIGIDGITVSGEQEMQIQCLFGSDLRITFRGPTRNAADLNNFLRDAKAVSPNH